MSLGDARLLAEMPIMEFHENVVCKIVTLHISAQKDLADTGTIESKAVTNTVLTRHCDGSQRV